MNKKQEHKIYTLEELENKLTGKQKKFCKEYIFDWNASRSALAAGYSKKSAYAIGNENLKKLEIQQYINFIKNDYEKNLNISKSKVIDELMKIAFNSIEAFHDSWIEKKDFDSISSRDKAAIQEISTRTVEDKLGRKHEQFKIKLYDKQKALEALNKMMQYNEAEKHDHEVKNANMPDLSKLTYNELLKLAGE